MATIIINEKSEEGRSLMNVIRTMRKSSDAVVNIYDDEIDEPLIFEPLPGIPHTPDQLWEAVRRSEEQYACGRTITIEQLKARLPRI